MKEKKPIEQRIFKLLLNEVKAYIPRMITFFIMLAIYSYIIAVYGFERMIMVALIVIVISLKGKK